MNSGALLGWGGVGCGAVWLWGRHFPLKPGSLEASGHFGHISYFYIFGEDSYKSFRKLNIKTSTP